MKNPTCYIFLAGTFDRKKNFSGAGFLFREARANLLGVEN